MARPSAAVHLLSNALSHALLWAKEPRAPRPPWGRSSFLCSSPCHGVLHPDLSLTPLLQHLPWRHEKDWVFASRAPAVWHQNEIKCSELPLPKYSVIRRAQLCPKPNWPLHLLTPNMSHSVGISLGYCGSRERVWPSAHTCIHSTLRFQSLELPLQPAVGTGKGQPLGKVSSALKRKGWFVLTIETSMGWGYYKDEIGDLILQRTFDTKFWKLSLFWTSCTKTNFWDKLLHWNFILRIIIFMDVILACIYTLY